jgi:diguanylate cyclase (GGDEF)-like protein
MTYMPERNNQYQELLSIEQCLAATVTRLRADLADVRSELARTRAIEARARHLSLHDGLTSLPNRSYFLDGLGSALARSGPQAPTIAVLYLDLDAFKAINDMHGHDVGDEVLMIIAARLSRAVRAGDMMSRIGGDEFACLPDPTLNWKQLGCLARNLIDVVSAPLRIRTLGLCVRPSIGIAIYPADGATAGELLASADHAMYRAKRDRAGFSFADRKPEPSSEVFRINRTGLAQVATP